MKPENQNTPLPCPCGEDPCDWYVAINFVEDRGYYAQLERDCGSRGPKVLEITRGAAIAKAKEAWGRIVRPKGEAAAPVKESLTTEGAPADVVQRLPMLDDEIRQHLSAEQIEAWEILRTCEWLPVATALQDFSMIGYPRVGHLVGNIRAIKAEARQAGREEAIKECAEIADREYRDDKKAAEHLGTGKPGCPFMTAALKSKAIRNLILLRLTPPTEGGQDA